MSVRNLHEVRFVFISTLFCICNIWLGDGPICLTHIFIVVTIYTVGPDVCRAIIFSRRWGHQWMLDPARDL